MWQLRETKIWGTEVDVVKFAERITSFLSSFKLADQTVPFYCSLMKLTRDKRRHLCAANSDINIDAQHVASFDLSVYRTLVKYPSEAILMIDVTLNQYFRDHLASDADDEIRFIARIYNLKDMTAMRSLGPADVDTLVSIKGMVTRVSKIIPEMKVWCVVARRAMMWHGLTWRRVLWHVHVHVYFLCGSLSLCLFLWQCSWSWQWSLWL